MRVMKLTFFIILLIACAYVQASLQGKKVLVTGGCGFIGSHLVEALVAEGAQVTILDNLSTGKEHNIAAVKDQVRLIIGDINHQDDCYAAAHGQDIIFHLAALTAVDASMSQPIHFMQTNIQGTLHMLEAARLCNVQRFIFSSSAAVYGNKEHACKETDSCNPLSVYGYSKLVGEMYCRMYAEIFKVPTFCLRYFNVFGSRQDPASQYVGVITKFKARLAQGLPVTIFGDGLQTRDFVSVDQIVKANCMAAQLDASLCTGQACNVASGKNVTVLEMLDQLAIDMDLKNKIEVHYEPARVGDIRHSIADCSLLKALLK